MARKHRAPTPKGPAVIPLDLTNQKPQSLSATVGWKDVDYVTPWGRRLPVMVRFTTRELNQYWEANVRSGYTLDPAYWIRCKRNIP